MAVAAMVARQMRENQEKRDQPHSDWTEEQRELYELKQKSKSKLKVAAEPVKCVGTVLFSVRPRGGDPGEEQAPGPGPSQVLQPAPPPLPGGLGGGTPPVRHQSLRRLQDLSPPQMSPALPRLGRNLGSAPADPLLLLTFSSRRRPGVVRRPQGEKKIGKTFHIKWTSRPD